MRPVGGRAGFSLIELLVVIAVALVLAGLLFPAMAQVKENAHRVICSSNQRQIGIALLIYADTNGGNLPYSAAIPAVGHHVPIQWEGELMAASRGKQPGGEETWDGLGLLFSGGFCRSSECFYCPSHHGKHPPERYREAWEGRTDANQPIYTNYHYAGHKDWETLRPRRLSDVHGGALLTDGLRTTEDYNHRVGMNVLSYDGSVKWRDDDVFSLRAPLGAGSTSPAQIGQSIFGGGP